MAVQSKAQDLPPVEAALQAHPFFRGFSPEHIHALCECAQLRAFEIGEYFWRQGERGATCFLIQSGQVALEINVPNQGALPIEQLGDGELLGWSGLIEPYRWRFDARAITPVRALALDSDCLRAKCESNPELGYRLLKRCAPIVGERLDTARLKFIELYQDEMP